MSGARAVQYQSLTNADGEVTISSGPALVWGLGCSATGLPGIVTVQSSAGGTAVWKVVSGTVDTQAAQLFKKPILVPTALLATMADTDPFAGFGWVLWEPA